MTQRAVLPSTWNPRRASVLRHLWHKLLAWLILSWAPSTLSFALFLPLLFAGTAHALPPASDFSADAKQMREQSIPMVLMFSANGCVWCDKARQQFIEPMAASPDWAGRALFRQINIDSRATVTDFSGRPTTHAAFARARKARMTPTLIFLDAAGKEVAESIVGVRLADFYGIYIEHAIEAGLEKMKQ